MLNYINKIVIVLIVFCSFFAACSEDEDPIKFSVLSTGGNFTGYFKIDGGATSTFEGEIIDNNIYEFELKIKELDYLEIVACKNAPSQSLEVKIYRDEVKVKSGNIEPNQQDSDDEYIYCLSLDYEYGEEEDDSTETTTEE